MFDIFGEFDSAEEINATAAGLLEEGDLENISVLAKENGLEDLVEIYTSGAMGQLTDSFMAAVGKLTVESKEKEVIEKSKRIPSESIIEYLISRCDEAKMAAAIRKRGKSLLESLNYIEKEAEKIVKADKPYLSDMTVFMMAVEYYLKEGDEDEKEKSIEPSGTETN